MPQGGIEEAETAREAALRELQEELGTSNAEIIAETKTWFCYDLPAEFLEGSRHGRWRGQQQKWFLMLFRGQDSDIGVATETPEFSQWQWVTTDRLIEREAMVSAFPVTWANAACVASRPVGRQRRCAPRAGRIRPRAPGTPRRRPNSGAATPPGARAPAAVASHAARISAGTSKGGELQPSASRVAATSAAPSAAPCTSWVPALWGLPLPMMVLQQTSVGRSPALVASSSAASMAAASWPSTSRMTRHP